MVSRWATVAALVILAVSHGSFAQNINWGAIDQVLLSGIQSKIFPGCAAAIVTQQVRFIYHLSLSKQIQCLYHKKQFADGASSNSPRRFAPHAKHFPLQGLQYIKAFGNFTYGVPPPATPSFSPAVTPQVRAQPFS
jgi:phosphate/sulfate permease